MVRPSVLPCSLFRGRSPKTGRLVGQRHRWSGYAAGKGWGTGHCLFCHNTLGKVFELKPRQEHGKSGQG